MKSTSSKWLLGVGVAVLVLIAASVILTLSGPSRGVETFPEDVPQGVIQRFFLALQDQDYALAHSYLNERLSEACTVEHVRETSRWAVADQEQGLRVAMLGEKVLSDGSTQVRVRVTTINIAPPFGVNENSHDQLYVLAREGGQWRFQSPPWPVDFCPGPEEIKETPTPAAVN